MTAAKRQFCAVKGCGKRLAKINASGVCMVHTHAPDACRCPECQGLASARRRGLQDRPGVRQVVMPYATGNSGIDGTVRVSLPREPWIKKGDA